MTREIVMAEMEHQTTQDATSGAEQPLEQRGTQKADAVGESPCVGISLSAR
jgi:hypothetical protein